MKVFAAAILFVVLLASVSPLYQAASILHGEAPIDCPMCRKITACALAADQRKGIDLPSRWYGWRAARQEDIDLIEWAENLNNCASIPACRYVYQKSKKNINQNRSCNGNDN